MDAEKELDYVVVLRALKELPFNVGRKTLVSFLQGDLGNNSVARNNLDNVELFGTFKNRNEDEISNLIDNLLNNKMIDIVSVPDNKFAKVLELNYKGNKEILNPTLFSKKLAFNLEEVDTVISEKEKEFFKELDFFLGEYNDEQKKAITFDEKEILCIAGAGSGKTSVLTKRIEFLIKYRNVNPDKILAVTFTRKARQEMINRLSEFGLSESVKVETFNSFCEKILKEHGNLIYGREVSVINYSNKVKIIQLALEELGLSFSEAIRVYFGKNKLHSKTREELVSIFINDCFFIRDYFKSQGKVVGKEDFEAIDESYRKTADIVSKICIFIERFMEENGLRDFSDQIIDTINFFKLHKDLIPEFDHVLIDEYQDVNSSQIKLVEILKPENLFCVGDPRQAIYGWRGSEVQYILDFKKWHAGCKIISLKKNYRSTKRIVSLINDSIRDMGISDLESGIDLKSAELDTRLIRFDSIAGEFQFVAERILSANLPRGEIFVLARTNNQIRELSEVLKSRGIAYQVKSENSFNEDISKGVVTLATIHSIKGLEAEMVIVIGCSNGNFPIYGSEHPIIDMVKAYDYDKEEEEKRLFYVAMSRAKRYLYLTYSGKNYTYFIKESMLPNLGVSLKNKIIFESPVESNKKSEVDFSEGDKGVVMNLKSWRKGLSNELGIPAYQIMTNRTLLEISQTLPKNFSDLNKINGIGESKLERFGSEILRIVSENSF
ncbi:hypothetical protein COU53_03765 [Candidatus Pacearchaeota archaeon CG10_big_fil_rev_8_21_14_0_10_30_48]|nr:MAG: hypothetical protein COU53_03765 [Candidatus Pacearchaeota archaeon CG10_big_fil_rev_8_21_14_0_10_30_48]